MEEFNFHPPPHPHPVFLLSDDGRISRHEYTSYQTQHDPELNGLAHELYNIYDFNGDHHLVMDDYIEFYRTMDSDGRWLVSNWSLTSWAAGMAY